jgi:hypothetical protein
MKFYCYLIFAFIGCRQSEQPTFSIKHLSVELEEKILKTFKVRHGYLCLTELGNTIYLTDALELQPHLTTEKQHPIWIDISIHTDTLVGTGIEVGDTSTYYFHSDSYSWLQLDHIPASDPFFKDDRFTVEACCFGEFGGAVFFNEENTGQLYSTPATCPLKLDRVGDELYLTNTLAHLGGLSQVVKITAPEHLYDLTQDTFRNHCNWWINYATQENDYAELQKYEIGTEILLDTFSLITLTAFEYQLEYYLMTIDFHHTYLHRLVDNQLETIYRFTDLTLPHRNGFTKPLEDGFIYSFVNGFLQLSNNEITLVTFL